MSHNRTEGIDVAGGRYSRTPYALVSSYCTPDEFWGGGGRGERGSRAERQSGPAAVGGRARRRLGLFSSLFFLLLLGNGVQV